MKKVNNKLKIELIPPIWHQYAENPSLYILEKVGKDCPWDRANFQQFLRQIEGLYKGDQEGVYYHNLTHAFDVMTTLDAFIKCANLINKLQISEQQRVLYLIAAYAHDNGHEGLTNQHYIQNNHELAITYLYSSPLQNMHASNLLRLLDRNKIQISLKMKKRLAGMILSTDNIYHHQKINKLAKIVDQPLKQHQQLILNSLLHAADISNPIKQFQYFQKWSNLIQCQFTRQKSLEGIQFISDITYHQKLELQKQFADSFVMPFYIQLQVLLPQFKQYVNRIQANIQLITNKHAQIQPEKKEAGIK